MANLEDLEDLERLDNLKKLGIISQQKFDQQKDAILKATLTNSGAKSQIAYCILALLLGQFGVHNFYVGRWKRALAQLLLTLLSPFTLYITLFVSDIWSIINIFTIHTDGKNQEFNPCPTAKFVCGILGIVWYVIVVIGIMSVAGIAGYATAMRKYKANELAAYAATVSMTAQKNDNQQTPVDCSSVYPVSDSIAPVKCELQSDNVVVFDEIGSALKEDLLKNGAKQDSDGHFYFQF